MKKINKKLMGIIFVLFISSYAYAEKSAVENSKDQNADISAPEKVDVKNLEKRYWAPKNKKFKVVQNRTYTKTKKIYLSLMPSFMLNEEYSNGFGFDVAVGYFFNDRWGLELEYQVTNLEDNDLQQDIIQLGGFGNHGKSKNYYGVAFNWMPFFAKMSFLGKKIVYFDFSVGLTLGLMNYEQQLSCCDSDGNPVANIPPEQTESSLAYGFQISQSFYLSKRFLIRADYKHRFYNQDIVSGAASSSSQQGDFLESRVEDSISLNLGLTVLF